MKFKIYQCLTKLSQELYSVTDDLLTNYSICWKNASLFAEAITSDIQSISGIKCFVTGVRFILEDTAYKQSASGCIMELKFDQEDEFIITSECLIDFGRVWLRVKQRPSSRKYDAIFELIEAKYDSEFKSELKEFEK
ncbi:hypothetical protein [Pontibacter chinhatensis]|uniref:Uncharacterized protein n=1 Tax=Pontibacter chinhatensis TaxID=1436961 RepID=A0A1I2ZKN2_9BACT|nr:hypothetical protein [Pontibacter chinhatensis]SFH37681.1 hypothetical protein SAMN05421739_11431 [Pontibacter chinhatensis]